MKIKVSNLGGVANQFVIEAWEEEGLTPVKYFQSYDTVIACRDKFRPDRQPQITLDPKYNFSRTTTKYLLMFLGVDAKTLAARVKDGTYEIANLNG